MVRVSDWLLRHAYAILTAGVSHRIPQIFQSLRPNSWIQPTSTRAEEPLNAGTTDKPVCLSISVCVSVYTHPCLSSITHHPLWYPILWLPRFFPFTNTLTSSYSRRNSMEKTSYVIIWNVNSIRCSRSVQNDAIGSRTANWYIKVREKCGTGCILFIRFILF
jgi:hypothetical protein